MKKKYFVLEYFIEGLVLATAATNYIPAYLFLPAFVGLYAALYATDGYQASTLYYIPIAGCLFAGRAMGIEEIDTFICVAVVLMQYVDGNIYHLPENKKLVGFRKEGEGGEEYFEFFPLEPRAKRGEIAWNQGKAFEKVVESKQAKGVMELYYRLTLSYIARMKIVVGQGVEKTTDKGMAFYHGRDAAPLWYSSLFVHFASNDVKVIARQHPDLAPIVSSDKKEMKQIREKELQTFAEQYYQSILRLKTEKLILVGHSYGCAAVLLTYFTHLQLRDRVSHIILMDPYLFPLPDKYLTTAIACPTLILSNQYLLNFEDLHTRQQSFMGKKNVQCIIWKAGADIYQTDLCCFIPTNEHWQTKFKMNFETINNFMKGSPVEATLGDLDLGRQYKPESFLPEKYFVF